MELLKREIIHTDKENQEGEFFVAAAVDISPGEIVSELNDMPKTLTNSPYMITKGFGEFFDTTNYPEYRINHSCNPNVHVCFADNTMRASRQITKGEELTFNYMQTEYEMAGCFDCKCGAQNCLGRIAGFKNLSAIDKAALVKNASPWIQYNYYFRKDEQELYEDLGLAV